MAKHQMKETKAITNLAMDQIYLYQFIQIRIQNNHLNHPNKMKMIKLGVEINHKKQNK